MKRIPILLILAMFALPTTSSYAQECPCDCYFSGDCEGGAFCNWGNLSVEDSCFWRQPKPQGVPGAGCQDDYNDWGQCDGICDPSTTTQLFSEEPIPDLIEGIALWAKGFDDAAASGTAFVEQSIVDQIEHLNFADPFIVDALGKIVIEVNMLARGEHVIIFPQYQGYVSSDVQIINLAGDACRMTAGTVATRTLLAEMTERGSGQHIMAAWPAVCRDIALLSRVCRGQDDSVECLYGRIQDFADAIVRGGRGGNTAAASGGANCAGECTTNADCNDGNPCTADICNAQSECVNPNTSGSCDDGDDCTGNDSCQGGVCQGGGPATCDGPCDDCNNNNIPDECEALEDCNANKVPDSCELEGNDCNSNGVPDDCEMFLVCPPGQPCTTFNDCNNNDQLDECDIASGKSDDENENGVPDECEKPSSPALIAEGSRYLRVSPAHEETTVALRISAPAYPCWVKYVDTDGDLVDTPVYQDNAAWGSTYLKNSMIVPDATYQAEAVSQSGIASDPVLATTWKFGDATNNGVTNFEDIQQTVFVFQGNLSQRSVQNTDNEPCEPNGVVNFVDVLRTAHAFQGMEYDETGCAMPCQ